MKKSTKLVSAVVVLIGLVLKRLMGDAASNGSVQKVP